jgi:hypothetical protein
MSVRQPTYPSQRRPSTRSDGHLPDPTWLSCLTCLIIRLIIQTIRRDPSGADQIDDPSNVSSADPSGADQIDAEHQATDLAVGGSNPSRRATNPAGQRPCNRVAGCYRGGGLRPHLRPRWRALPTPLRPPATPMARPDPASPRWSTRRQQRSAMGAACGRLVASSPGVVELPEGGRRRLELVAGGWLPQRSRACLPPWHGRALVTWRVIGLCLRVGDAAGRPHLGWRTDVDPTRGRCVPLAGRVADHRW